jgi:hypothetical protein
MLALLAIASMSWTYATADSKIARDLLAATSARSIAVRLRFPPEKFHMLLLQELGRIESVDGREVRLLDVPPQRIRAFARHFWVASIGDYAPSGRTGPSSSATRH